MNIMKPGNIAKLVIYAAVVAGNWTLAEPASASQNDIRCNILSQEAIDYIKLAGDMTVGAIAGYGDLGVVVPADHCPHLVERVEKGVPGYSIKVTAKDYRRHKGGTTYEIIKLKMIW